MSNDIKADSNVITVSFEHPPAEIKPVELQICFNFPESGEKPMGLDHTGQWFQLQGPHWVTIADYTAMIILKRLASWYYGNKRRNMEQK